MNTLMHMYVKLVAEKRVEWNLKKKRYVNLIEYLVWVGFCGYWSLVIYIYIQTNICAGTWYDIDWYNWV